MNHHDSAPGAWLKSDRLSLREFSLTDRYSLVRMHQDSRVRDLLIDDRPLEKHTYAKAFIERLQEFYRQHEGLGIWCAECMVSVLSEAELSRPQVREMLSDYALEKYSKPQPKFAGWFNLLPMPDNEDEVQLGSRLLPEFWGVGLALEGGTMLLNHAFDTLQLQRIWAVSHIDHRSVRFCVTTLGFEDYGVREYEDKPAQHYVIDSNRWQQWSTLSRRERMQYALASCKTNISPISTQVDDNNCYTR